MRKLSSILFLVLFCLYTLGPIAFQLYAPVSVKKQWQKRLIDEDDPRLSTLEIPMQMPPYVRDQEEFQYTDGMIKLGDHTFRKVFQKFSKDTLYLKVIRDDLTLSYRHSLEDWINSVHNERTDSSNSTDSRELVPGFFKEYVVKGFSFQPIHLRIPKEAFGYLLFAPTHHIQVTTPPPQV